MRTAAFVFLAVGIAMLGSVAASTGATWNVTLPRSTCSPINAEGGPTPDAVAFRKHKKYAYIDSQYFVNVLDTDTGASVWSAAGFSSGLQAVDDYGVLLALNQDSGLQAYNVTTGALLWTQMQGYGTETLPTHLYNGRLLTASYAGNDNIFVLYQVDIVTGNTTWVIQNIKDNTGECGDGQTIVNNMLLQDLGALAVNISNGAVRWFNNRYWGSWVGCLTSGHTRWGAIKNDLVEGPPIVTIFNAHSGHVIRNVSVSEHFHTDQVFGVFGAIFCAQVSSGQYSTFESFIDCYDGESGARTMHLNVTNALVQSCFALAGGVVGVLERNYATSGAVALRAFDPATGAEAWSVRTYTPYTVDTYYVPEQTQIGTYIVLNHDDGFTALSHDVSFNVTDLGTTVRVDSITTLDDFTTSAFVLTRNHGFGLRL